MTPSMPCNGINGPRPGEIVVDSDKTANLVREHRRLARALNEVADFADQARCISEQVNEALRLEPEYDAIPRTILVDDSWADTLPPCVECGHDVEWGDALLMPCSSVEDGDVDRVGVIHCTGCPPDDPSPGVQP